MLPFRYLFAVCAFTIRIGAAIDPVSLNVTVDKYSGDFNVFLVKHSKLSLWLRSAGVGVRHDSQWWTSNNKDGHLLKMMDQLTGSGKDILGEFDTTTIFWEAYTTPTNIEIETRIRVYRNEPVVYFTLVYTSGLVNASIPDDATQTVSRFPSFVVEEANMTRGYFTWSGNMAKDIKIGKWSSTLGDVYGNVDGGFPLVVFNADMDTALVLSPATSFMSATQYSFKDEQTNETVMTFGPMSSIDKIPAGYKYSTILVASNNVTGAMRKFGEVLRTLYSKKPDYRRADYSINYLGYWTDNGACYYYTTGSNYSNYEDLIVAVKKNADESGLPFQYVQLDSWWYYKGPDNGVKNWTARGDIFPHGIDAVVKETGWRMFAHNRWWSNTTDYQTKYKFIIEEDAALPVDPAFWDYLISSSQRKWSLLVYEQDWLYVQFIKTKALRTQLDLGEQWLMEMGKSAERYGVTVQYCMPWTRHILQSVAIPAVTQVRVSDDYQPSNSQWIIGDTTILAHAMGLAAFKDNFRSSSKQPDCHKYSSTMTELYPALETYVSALSGGPIGPSDQIGTANVTLVMATCMKDGRLLKPTRPAMSIDSTFVQRAFGSGGPDGQLWIAFTAIDGYTWYYIFAAELTAPYSLSTSELPPSHTTFPATTLPIPSRMIAFQYTLDGKVTKTLTLFSHGSITKLDVPQCGKSDFQYYVFAPCLPNGVAMLGELTKVITVSETRYSDFRYRSSNTMFTVKVSGAPNEVVMTSFYYQSNGHIETISCYIGSSGMNVLSIGANPDVDGSCRAI